MTDEQLKAHREETRAFYKKKLQAAADAADAARQRTVALRFALYVITRLDDRVSHLQLGDPVEIVEIDFFAEWTQFVADGNLEDL
jgi:hypothetical protein